jgi:hypothetical protein
VSSARRGQPTLLGRTRHLGELERAFVGKVFQRDATSGLIGRCENALKSARRFVPSGFFDSWFRVARVNDALGTSRTNATTRGADRGRIFPGSAARVINQRRMCSVDGAD